MEQSTETGHENHEGTDRTGGSPCHGEFTELETVQQNQ